MIGVDKNGKPFAALKVELTVETTEEGAFQAGVAEWFRADTGKPITDGDLAEIEEWCSTRIALAMARCNELGITDADLRATAINAGRAARTTDEDYNVVINVVEAAADEQRRRNAATPALDPPTPTSE